MINTKKVLLILFAVLIPTLAIVTSISTFKKEEGEVLGAQKSTVGKCIPYITNLMPNQVNVGEEYYFFPKVVGCNINDVEISLKGVDWLSVRESKYIFGIPSKDDVGVNTVVVTVKGLSDTSTYIEYIVVE